MAVDISTRLAEVFSGERRVAALPTAVIAVLVTALVGVPLLLRAIDSDPPMATEPGIDPAALTVTFESAGPVPLDGATISGEALISLDAPGATGASFGLFAADDDLPLLTSQDLVGPTFSPILGPGGAAKPLDSTDLSDGVYALFVVVLRDSTQERTVAGFEVSNR